MQRTNGSPTMIAVILIRTRKSEDGTDSSHSQIIFRRPQEVQSHRLSSPLLYDAKGRSRLERCHPSKRLGRQRRCAPTPPSRLRVLPTGSSRSTPSCRRSRIGDEERHADGFAGVDGTPIAGVADPSAVLSPWTKPSTGRGGLKTAGHCRRLGHPVTVEVVSRRDAGVAIPSPSSRNGMQVRSSAGVPRHVEERIVVELALSDARVSPFRSLHG